MVKKLFLLLTLTANLSWVYAQMLPWIPGTEPQDESLLLEAALEVEPEILEGGYRQYDLTVARMTTWGEEKKEIIVRLILPAEKTDQMLPLVAYVHGGGYIGGSPLVDINEREGRFGNALRALLDNGFAVASMGYRLAREAGWPAQVTDVMGGLRFLGLHGRNWGIDTTTFGICGHSAGARLAVLLGSLEHDTFINPHDPWHKGKYSMGAVWMWAGSAWDWPSVDQWVEFGKPNFYSASSLLYGEHPAIDDVSRHRFRLKAAIPHISMALPPLYKLRPASDYRGEHDDALKTMEVWRALGADATLAILPGGHNTVGPTDSLVLFFTRHIKNCPLKKNKERNPSQTAKVLNDLGENKAAIEVLVQANTKDHGYTLPEGQWLILSDQSLLWCPLGTGWTEKEQVELARARHHLALAEAAFANDAAGQADWFCIMEAASNAMKLGKDDREILALYNHAKKMLEEQREALQILHKANHYWHRGRFRKTKRLLRGHAYGHLLQSQLSNAEKQKASPPAWANLWGHDLFGQWATLKLGQEFEMRFRWVAPGNTTLPEHLHFRNTTSDPWVTQLNIRQGFWFAETETTTAQWHAANRNTPHEACIENCNHPVNMIDYLQIIDWLKDLNSHYPDITLRLPTEQEWLHAAISPDYRYPSASIVAVHALTSENLAPGIKSVNHSIADLKGFVGLLGGVMEWTASPGHSIAYVTNNEGNRQIISYPITRGGAWSNMPQSLNPGLRIQQRHGNRQHDLGFRVLLQETNDQNNWLDRIIK